MLACCFGTNSQYGHFGGGSVPVDPDKLRINNEIEKQLKEEKKQRKSEHRILLLGCGEAGKSTFIKQMRIIHSEGFSDAERREFQNNISVNIVSAIQTLIFNSELAYEDEDVAEAEAAGADLDQALIEAVKRVNGLSARAMPSQVLPLAEDISLVWKQPEIQHAYANRHRFQLVECAKYFLNRVSVVLQPDYLPENQDVLQARSKTTGIIEHDFNIKPKNGGDEKKLILIDVGGQRSERKKWIHCFEDVMMLLFLTAVSEYDQVLEEDEKTNRMKESMGLFHTILNYVWFAQTNVILFLNKMDVLKEKMERSPIQNYFADFEGQPNTQEAAIRFFEAKFQALNPNPKERSVYAHATCATDTENIKIVDVLVQDTILTNLLSDIMIS